MQAHCTKLAGLLPRGLPSLLHDFHCKALPEVPSGSEWVLLLVLHLLRELRDPRSPWLSYIGMLPAPPGSLVKAVCCDGPDATDLLLFRCNEDVTCRPLQLRSVMSLSR